MEEARIGLRLGPAREFIGKYGDKGYLILKAIIDSYRAPRPGPGLGDFSYKQVKEYLERKGVFYNPSPLLSKLEKEYMLIETTYKSSGQHWWRIVDPEEIEAAIREYEGDDSSIEEDYRVRMLRIQFYALEPDRILDTLTRLSRKRRLTESDRSILRRIAFEDLPRLVEFLEKAEEYADLLEPEMGAAESILSMLEKLVSPRAGRLGVRWPSERGEARVSPGWRHGTGSPASF
ncbi:MAG: hypothetical protein LRS48_02135 [Desulfurococcales archaeon]|nr:hypothetical protein [Desulfurococcales archaeon]